MQSFYEGGDLTRNMNIFNLILVQPLANGLVLFYKVLWQNMGLAIIAFSFFLRFILNP